MNLRRQLMLVSLLLLALPWAGCQYVREMEGALQSGQARALLATAHAVATVIGERAHSVPALDTESDPQRALYAELATAPVIVDGYADGWDGPEHARFGPVAYRAKVRDGTLYLLFSVRDDQVVYHNPRHDHPSGDHLVLQTGGGEYLIATAAPGAVQGRTRRPGRAMAFEPRIRGFWQDSLEGFTVELEMPLSMPRGRLAFSFVQSGGSDVPERFGTIDPRRGPPRLVVPSASLQQELQAFAQAGIVLAAVDPQHWVIAEAGDPDSEPAAGGSDTPWLLSALYRAILNGAPPDVLPESPRAGQMMLPELDAALAGDSAAAWYASPRGGGRKLLVSATPVFRDGELIGAVVAKQGSEPYLSLTDQAFSRLLYWSLLALLVSALGLLGYASWLSWRIRRLSRASASIIRPDGSIDGNFPVSRSADEIGELSRQYAELLDRLRDYTDYLRTLSRKLSHELRTPIAVIQSSLDNLDADSGDRKLYVTRAREGLSRLANILTAMSEATRLEESVHNNQPEAYDLAALCRDLFEAYRSLYPDHRLALRCEFTTLPAYGVPDLIAQMLDKLMDNAASFTPAGGSIVLGLDSHEGQVDISVSNDGPLLPEAMQHQLFDSMVSVRDRSDRVHLGLGLHIVRLIVEFHRGHVWAENRPDDSGVTFVAAMPLDARD